MRVTPYWNDHEDLTAIKPDHIGEQTSKDDIDDDLKQADNGIEDSLVPIVEELVADINDFNSLHVASSGGFHIIAAE